MSFGLLNYLLLSFCIISKGNNASIFSIMYGFYITAFEKYATDYPRILFSIMISVILFLLLNIIKSSVLKIIIVILFIISELPLLSMVGI